MISNGRLILKANEITGAGVVNLEGEDIGNIEELVVDTQVGYVAYAVLSFGGYMGLGDKYFAIPWGAFAVEDEGKKIVLNVSKEILKDAEGFDKNNWPDMADLKWGETIYDYYGYPPYWL